MDLQYQPQITQGHFTLSHLWCPKALIFLSLYILTRRKEWLLPNLLTVTGESLMVQIFLPMVWTQSESAHRAKFCITQACSVLHEALDSFLFEFQMWDINRDWSGGCYWMSPPYCRPSRAQALRTLIYRLLYFQCHTDRLWFTVLAPKIKEKLWGSEGERNNKVKLKFSRQSVVWLNLREALQSGSFPVSWLPIWHEELSRQVFSKGTHMDHDANSTNWPNLTEIPRHLNKKKSLSRITP